MRWYRYFKKKRRTTVGEKSMHYEVKVVRCTGRPKKTLECSCRLDNQIRKTIWTTGNGES